MKTKKAVKVVQNKKDGYFSATLYLINNKVKREIQTIYAFSKEQMQKEIRNNFYINYKIK